MLLPNRRHMVTMIARLSTGFQPIPSGFTFLFSLGGIMKGAKPPKFNKL